METKGGGKAKKYPLISREVEEALPPNIEITRPLLEKTHLTSEAKCI